MQPHPAEPELPEDQRKAIFRALVEAQDQEMTVPQSRQLVARRYNLTVAQVKGIEREGLEGLWPPL